MYSPPQKLQKLTIELTTDCNLKCRGCPRTISDKAGTWSNLSMTASDFAAILKNLPYIDFVTLHGIGEPFLNPDFLDIVDLAKRSGKFGRMKVTSNGLTRSVGFMKSAIDKGLDEIWISVDSLDPFVAESLRAGTKVEKLARVLKDLVASKLPIRISTVVSRVNYLVLDKTIEELYLLGNPPIHIQEFQDFGDDSVGMLTRDERLEFSRSMNELKKKYSNIRLNLPGFIFEEGEYCNAPWLRPAISVEGFLTPCCTTFDPSHFGYSNVKTETYESIFAGPSVQGWLVKMLNNEIVMCNGCGLNPRKRGFDNQLSRSGKTLTDPRFVNIKLVS